MDDAGESRTSFKYASNTGSFSRFGRPLATEALQMSGASASDVLEPCYSIAATIPARGWRRERGQLDWGPEGARLRVEDQEERENPGGLGTESAPTRHRVSATTVRTRSIEQHKI